MILSILCLIVVIVAIAAAIKYNDYTPITKLNPEALEAAKTRAAKEVRRPRRVIPTEAGGYDLGKPIPFASTIRMTKAEFEKSLTKGK